MNHSVIGLVKDRLEADNLVNALRSAGFSDSQLSVLFPDKEGFRDFAHDNTTKAPEGGLTGAVAGGAIGGTIGLLAGIGALAIPGLGALIAAGPIMAALSGAAAGATVLGVTGALVGLGVPEFEAKMYEGKIRDGNILLAVHGENKDQLKRAEELFKQYHASDVHRVGETPVKKN